MFYTIYELNKHPPSLILHTIAWLKEKHTCYNTILYSLVTISFSCHLTKNSSNCSHCLIHVDLKQEHKTEYMFKTQVKYATGNLLLISNDNFRHCPYFCLQSLHVDLRVAKPSRPIDQTKPTSKQ